MTQKHSPGPFVVGSQIIGDSFQCHIFDETVNNTIGWFEGRSGVFETDKANAEFIVKACNSYYDMLEACETVRDILMQESEEVWEFEILRLNKAIKKAEEE